jgi:hypothetical protein
MCLAVEDARRDDIERRLAAKMPCPRAYAHPYGQDERPSRGPRPVLDALLSRAPEMEQNSNGSRFVTLTRRTDARWSQIGVCACPLCGKQFDTHAQAGYYSERGLKVRLRCPGGA